jgi:hypothetical protein
LRFTATTWSWVDNSADFGGTAQGGVTTVAGTRDGLAQNGTVALAPYLC